MVSKKKLAEVEKLAGIMGSHPILGIVDTECLPSSQFQAMRKSLKGIAVIRVTKKRLLRRALESVKQTNERMSALEPYIKGMPALIVTKENPFRLAKIISKSKSQAYARPGQAAPSDIAVEPQKTSFAPGPIISELAKFGLKTAVEEGKIVIKTGATIVKAGEIIDAKKAELLMKLGIQPMEIGLNIAALYEDGLIYDKELLSVDEKEYMGQLNNLYTEAFNIAVFCWYPTKDSIGMLLSKTYKECRSLVHELGEKGFATRDNIGSMLVKAEMQALALKALVKE